MPDDTAPNDVEILPVEIHLPGLLKLLGEHLYADPQAAVREMVQNAHDSCVRRREEDTANADYAPAIHVRLDHAAKQLIIEDNGSGLTRDEIVTFLATVGRGYTRELRERLGDADRAEALDLIGLFGLGLLSAFMIATRIDITTASYQDPDTAWRWISDGGQSCALRRATRDEVGTTTRLDLRDDALFLLQPGVLSGILRTYAEFLPVPITIGDDAEPINGQPAPWAVDEVNESPPARALRYGAWVQMRLGVQPLAVVPLRDAQIPDGSVIPLRGVLFVPPRSVISVQEYGDVTAYVRHMLITERERDLLPEWARFVTGVIDCPLLNPTASREALRHDDTYRAVQAALSAQLLTHFEHLAEVAPLDWAAIVQAHNDLIKVWSVRTVDLFTRVADLVTFPTSRGKLTIPDYLRQNPGRIFYYQDDEGVTQALALFEARRLAVIDARFSFDAAFLRVYGEVYGVPVEELKPEAGYIFSLVDDSEGVWRHIIAAFRAQGFPVKLVAYEPEHLPVILLFPPGAERLRRAQRTVEEGRVAGPIRSLVRGFLDRQQMDDSVIKGTLHLNARNALLRRVRDLGPQHPQFAPLIGILVANARMFAGQGLSAQDAIACFEQINRSLGQIAGLEAAPDGQTTLTPAMLTDLGLHPEAANRLCAVCETVEALLAADVNDLAERARISSLMLATVRAEIAQRQNAPPDEADANEPPQPHGIVISLAEAAQARAARNAEEEEPDERD